MQQHHFAVRIKWVLASGLIVVGLFMIAGYLVARGASKKTKAPENHVANGTPGVVRVEVTHPHKGAVERTTTQPGTLQSWETVQLYAGVSGYLKDQKVDIGDMVKKGDVLAHLDVPELEAQVKRCDAAVKQADSRVTQMKARADSARAEWQAAKAAVPRAAAMLRSKSAELRYRQLQLQRMRDLAASRSIEDKIVDETTTHRDSVREAEIAAQEAVTTANENVKAAAAKLEAADADVKEAQAEVSVAKADLEKANVLVGFASIVAPFDGVITQRKYFPGDYVRAANESGTQAPMLTVQRTDWFRVVVQIPDRDVPYADKDDPADVEIDALPGKKIPAKVARVSRSEDPDTRLMHIEIDIPNPTGKLCHGMYGRVTVHLDRSDLLAVPSACLVGKPQEGKGSVFVVRDGRARLVPVKLGADNGTLVGILSGLKADDDVIVNPNGTIVEGTAVAME